MGSAVATALSNWFDGVEAASALAMVVIAGLALRTWRKQDKAQKEAAFIDELVEAVHTYIAAMPVPITMADIAKIGMRAYAKSSEQAVEGAISWIEHNGDREGKRMMEALDAVQPSLGRVQSLTAKGQVFKFDDYKKCQDSVAMLGWQFSRIQSLSVVIGSTSWNWENPEVLKVLHDVLKIDTADIRTSIATSNVSIIEFSRRTYERLYG